MRKVIAWEGENKIPQQLLEIGSLQWGDQPIPVCSNNLDHNIIGKATDLRREDDGSVTAEIELLAHAEAILDEVSFTVYCNEVKGKHEPDIWRISSARIREIFMTHPQNVAW